MRSAAGLKSTTSPPDVTVTMASSELCRMAWRRASLWRSAASTALRALMSVTVPTRRVSRPAASAPPDRVARASSHFQLPSAQRMRSSASSDGARPCRWPRTAARVGATSSGCTCLRHRDSDHTSARCACPSKARKLAGTSRVPVARSRSHTPWPAPSSASWRCSSARASSWLRRSHCCSARISNRVLRPVVQPRPASSSSSARVSTPATASCSCRASTTTA